MSQAASPEPSGPQESAQAETPFARLCNDWLRADRTTRLAFIRNLYVGSPNLMREAFAEVERARRSPRPKQDR